MIAAASSGEPIKTAKKGLKGGRSNEGPSGDGRRSVNLRQPLRRFPLVLSQERRLLRRLLRFNDGRRLDIARVLGNGGHSHYSLNAFGYAQFRISSEFLATLAFGKRHIT
jgi:hypothetical protein